MYQQPTAIEGVTPCGLPAYTPVQIPWLVPKDFDFEFHQQWGHGILTGTWSNLTLTTDPSPISPTLGLVLTLDSLSKPYPMPGAHEHMVDELAKYYALPSVSLRDVVYHRMKVRVRVRVRIRVPSTSLRDVVWHRMKAN